MVQDFVKKKNEVSNNLRILPYLSVVLQVSTLRTVLKIQLYLLR